MNSVVVAAPSDVSGPIWPPIEPDLMHVSDAVSQAIYNLYSSAGPGTLDKLVCSVPRARSVVGFDALQATPSMVVVRYSLTLRI